MKKVRRFLKDKWFYIVALMLPCMIVFIRSLVMNTWVTGNGSIMKGDMTMQLLPFYYELWNKVHSLDSFAFTWNIANGIDFYSVVSYLFSPFTILVMLVPENWIIDTVQLIMVLKWSLSSFTMVYFFYHTSHNNLKERKKEISLFLGLAFAIGNAMINYILYLQFMDVLIWFPILLLLVEKLVKEGKWKVYYLVLTFCIFSNNYISYEICIFLIIWFFMQFNSQTKNKIKKFFVFAGSSILAAATCTFTLLSTYVLAQNRVAVENSQTVMGYINTIFIDLKDFISQMFMFTEISETSSVQPNMYISILAATLLIFFVFIKIGIKRKIYMSASALLLVLSLFFGSLSIVWHLFSVPNSVYHRFLFLVVFMLLFLVLYVLQHLSDIKMWQIIVAFFVELILIIYTFLNIKEYDSFVVYYITFLLWAFYILLLFFYKRKSITYKNILLAFMILGIGELTVNAYNAFQTYDTSSVDYFCEIEEMAESVQMNPGEKFTTSQSAPNVFAMSNQPSVSGFVSNLNGYNRLFYERMGMGVNGRVAYDVRGASPLLNLIFNVRYGVGVSEIEFSDAEKINEKGEFQLYRMKRLAGLGYMVDDEILDWDIYSDNCFDVQNSFLKKAVDGEEIFSLVRPTDIRCSDLHGIPISIKEEYKDLTSYVYSYETLSGDENDSAVATFTVEEDMDLYVYEYDEDSSRVLVAVDDELIYNDFISHLQNTFHIGDVKKGQKVSIYIVPIDNEIGVQKEFLLRFAKYADAAYAKSYEKLCNDVYEVETFESDYIKGSIDVEKAGIMMTSIQAIDGFDVYVDGEHIEYKTIAGALIGVPLDKGKHIVEFKYHSPVPVFGKYISIAAFAIFIIICIIGRKKKENDIVNIENEG